MGFEAELSVKIHIREDERPLRAETVRAVEGFVDQRLRQTASAVRGNGADGLEIGVVGVAEVPDAAAGGGFSRRVKGGEAQVGIEMRSDARNDLLRALEFLPVRAVVEALPEQPLQGISIPHRIERREAVTVGQTDLERTAQRHTKHGLVLLHGGKARLFGGSDFVGAVVADRKTEAAARFRCAGLSDTAQG